MAREMERMDHDRKLELIASGLGGSYVIEWDGIDFHIVSFVHYMYMHRKEKYDWLETIHSSWAMGNTLAAIFIKSAYHAVKWYYVIYRCI